MDLIERIFGVYPDGGSGATEALCIVALLAAALAGLVAGATRIRRSRRKRPNT